VEIKGQLDATDWFFLNCKTYCPLNMFRAPLRPSSGAQELYRWLLPVVHGAVKTENVIKVGEYWYFVSTMLSCVTCVCLKTVERRGDSVWVSQAIFSIY